MDSKYKHKWLDANVQEIKVCDVTFRDINPIIAFWGPFGPMQDQYMHYKLLCNPKLNNQILELTLQFVTLRPEPLDFFRLNDLDMKINVERQVGDRPPSCLR